VANYKNFADSSSPVRVEVEGTGGPSGAYSNALLSAMQAIVSAIGAQVSQMSDEQKPTELVIEFGLKGLADGGFAVSLDRTQANFGVSAKWGGDQGGGGLLSQLPSL
jgi:hypothetical protein